MFKYALGNLLSRPLRSLLALLGLTVAIVGMVALFSVAEGLDSMVSETFEQIPGLVAMQPGAPIPLFSSLPADWEDDLRRVPGVAEVNAEVWQRANVVEGKTVISPPRFLFGTDIRSRNRLTHAVYRDAIVEGRFLDESDIGVTNCVISRQISEEFDRTVGQRMNVGGFEMTIVGIYHCGSLLLDVAIILDIDEVRRMTRFAPGTVSAFYIEPDGSVSDDELTAAIRAEFRGREPEPWQPTGTLGSGGQNPVTALFAFLDRVVKSATDPRPETPRQGESNGQASESDAAVEGQTESSQAVETNEPPQKDASQPSFGAVEAADTDAESGLPIEIRTTDDWSERIDDISGDLDIFLLLITLIGVTIAVLSIINTMLMSVSERIIEIGILKANGWSKLDVLKLISYESAILGVGGGVLGCILGWCVTQVANATWPDRVNLYASPALLAFSLAFSTLLGVVSGLYPAVWAMRLMPMEAIRRG